MARQTVLHFYPERIVYIGAMALGGLLILAIPFLFILSQPLSTFSQGEMKAQERVAFPLQFSLNLSNLGPSLPLPKVEDELTFSFDPPRPDEIIAGERLLIRLKKGSGCKRVVLPCRLDLEYQRDTLTFAKAQSPFWVDLSLTSSGLIDGKCFIESEEGVLEAGHFALSRQECPIQTASEFQEGSCFRSLAEAKWWGKDQFLDNGSERLEIGNAELLELKSGEWLVWKDQKWQKSRASEKDLPIAHIQAHVGKNLVLEGWGSDGHIRVSLSPAVGPPFKLRAEEIFSAIRIRSEKQISCMLEKQCMVLKSGDWILKTNGRWKILRKKEERDAFLNGKTFGELFVLDQILQKQGQKMIQGRLFNPGRTQMIPVELAAQMGRKAGDKTLRKGKVQ